MTVGVSTCARSLIAAGECCQAGCDEVALVAVLVDDAGRLVEHTRCPAHVILDNEQPVASKALSFGRPWIP